ncbi:MAG: peptide-methionine (S)-S-oxide reductase MsrA [Anaeromyxobacter sp.]|nr:peptide-methionine (S)-S-oxide reductase MsrA [Anaeromyxobacter sp.]
MFGHLRDAPESELHHVSGHPLRPPFPEGLETACFGMGCFWGAEKAFWSIPGVFSTFVGYSGGRAEAPTYQQVCSGRTGHAEVVGVVFDPRLVSYQRLLQVFWEGHDPTQGDRQGNDVGTQYRSAIYTTTPAQAAEALASRQAYQAALAAGGHGTITTELRQAGPFFHAEGYHQQYLSKNPGGYCGHGGTGVACPIGTGVGAAAAKPAP